MTPTKAIEKARREMLKAIPEGREETFFRYIWQPPEKQQQLQALPEQGDPWEVYNYGPSDARPYYVMTLTGKRDKLGVPQHMDSVELFNKPDYARATVWDRLDASEPPSS